MAANVPPDIRDLQDQLDAAERNATALVAGLTEEQGLQRSEAGSWCIAECLDHLATANRVYLRAMLAAADRARTRGRQRRRPARPGWAGWLFVRVLEPPPRWWSRRKAPPSIRPGTARLGDAYAAFVKSQAEVRAFIRAHAGLDLVGVSFRNPFVRGIRFSLATGLHVITAHERRHLWQAWRVRQLILK